MAEYREGFREVGGRIMGAIRGIIRKGQVIMARPADLPDETEVEIVPVGLASPADDEGTIGPDEIARILTAMDRVEPLDMTPEEEAAIEADRRARKEWEKARFLEHADRLRDAWE
jgi:hypothetical protein